MKAYMWAVVSLIIAVSASAASADPWNVAMDANLTFTQNAYSDNWTGGEAGAISWVFNSNSLFEKQISPKLHTKNTLKLSFGQTHNQEIDTKNWLSPVKSTDLIDFETVFRVTIGSFVEPYFGGRIESQLLDASDPSMDRYFNPAKITESAGIAKVLIKSETQEWTARLGAGTRQLINRDVLDAVTLERETQTSYDAGMIFDSEFKKSMAEGQFTINSKLTVYHAEYYSEKDELAGLPEEDYWKYPDINWENIFTANITKYLMVNLYMQLLYDKQIDKGGRFKQTLALGLTYKIL